MPLRTSLFFQHTGLTTSEAVSAGAITARDDGPRPTRCLPGSPHRSADTQGEVAGPPVRQLAFKGVRHTHGEEQAAMLRALHASACVRGQ